MMLPISARASLATATLTLLALATSTASWEDEMAKYDVNGDSVVTKAEFDSRQESLANEEILEEFDEAAESDDETSPANSIGKFVEIQKSFSTPGAAATPARASLVISDFQTAYSVDAAIKTRSDWINPKFELGGYGIKFSPSLLVEAHVRSTTDSSQNSITFSTPILLQAYPAEGTKLALPELKGGFLQLSPIKFVTDNEFDTKQLTTELKTALTVPRIGIGQVIPLKSLFTTGDLSIADKSDVTFTWMPSIGFDGGVLLDGGGNPKLEGQDGIFRFVAGVDAQLWLTRRFMIEGSIAFLADLLHRPGSYVFIETGPVLYLDDSEKAAIGLTWKNGQAAPNFQQVNSLEAWFGVQL